MPRQGEVEVPKQTVTMLTDGSVTDPLTFVHTNGRQVRLLGTASATPPAVTEFFANGIPYSYGQGEAGRTIQEIFRGTSWTYLWVWSSGDATMVCYHA